MICRPVFVPPPLPPPPRPVPPRQGDANTDAEAQGHGPRGKRGRRISRRVRQQTPLGGVHRRWLDRATSSRGIRAGELRHTRYMVLHLSGDGIYPGTPTKLAVDGVEHLEFVW